MRGGGSPPRPEGLERPFRRRGPGGGGPSPSWAPEIGEVWGAPLSCGVGSSGAPSPGGDLDPLHPRNPGGPLSIVLPTFQPEVGSSGGPSSGGGSGVPSDPLEPSYCSPHSPVLWSRVLETPSQEVIQGSTCPPPPRNSVLLPPFQLRVESLEVPFLRRPSKGPPAPQKPRRGPKHCFPRTLQMWCLG